MLFIKDGDMHGSSAVGKHILDTDVIIQVVVYDANVFSTFLEEVGLRSISNMPEQIYSHGRTSNR